MKRTPLIAATALIALASTGVLATAQQADTPPTPPAAGADTAQRGPDRMAMFLERFDADGDGSVTRAEIEAEAAARFAAVDSNGDGELNAEEMLAAQESRREARREAGAERMIERLDTDGNGTLSAEELAAGPGRGGKDGRRGGDMFARLDADGDGVITTAELEQAKDRMMDGRGHHKGKGKGHGRGHDRDDSRGRR